MANRLLTGFKKTNADISLLEKISSITNYNVKKVNVFFMYYKLYRNFLDIITCILKNKYPIQAILRNGYHVTLHNYEEIGVLTRFLYMAKNHANNVEFDIKEDKVTFLSLPSLNNNSKLTLYGSITNGDAVGVFLENFYINLPVYGKTVIDIGANIADSSIFFALRGAKKVIGLEPFPKNYETAKRNVESNNLSDKITLMLAGCGANRGFVTISHLDKSTVTTVTSRIKNSSDGFKVPMLTLDDILKQNNLQNGELNILKMDCEGCEYESILSATRDTIRSFSDIHIEYHHGYKALKYKLEENGFIVSVSKPKLLRVSPIAGVSHQIRTYDSFYIGDIYAKLA